MNEFIENLRVRHQDAAKHLQLAQQKFNLAQAELQGAQQEYNSWTYAFQTETRKAQMEAAAAATAKQVGPPAPASNAAAPAPIADVSEVINKTNLVRGVLRQHPDGITPNEIWKELKTQIGDHAYIYSVLKRLKDREEIAKRRGGKYYVKHQQSPEENATQNGVVQR